MISPNTLVLLVLVVGIAVATLILYLPFFLWFRWRRSKGVAVGLNKSPTRVGWLWGIFTLALLAGVNSISSVAPDSTVGIWLGQEERYWLVVGAIFVIGSLGDAILPKLGFPLFYIKKGPLIVHGNADASQSKRST